MIDVAPRHHHRVYVIRLKHPRARGREAFYVGTGGTYEGLTIAALLLNGFRITDHVVDAEAASPRRAT